MNLFKKLVRSKAAVTTLMLVAASGGAAAQQGAIAAVDIDPVDVTETWRFPELQCGLLNASKLNTQIEEFSEAEINRVELGGDLGSS